MSIWNLSSVTESMSEPEVTVVPQDVEEMSAQYTMEGSVEESDMILHEAAVDMYKCEAAMYIADTFIERKSLTEGIDAAEIMLENVITNAAKNIVEALKKLWAKITGWFKSTIQNFEEKHLKGAAFLKMHEKRIDEQLKNGVKVNGLPMPDINALQSAVDKIYQVCHSYVFDKSKLPTKFESIEDFNNKMGDLAKEKDEFTKLVLGKCGLADVEKIADIKPALNKVAGMKTANAVYGQVDDEHISKELVTLSGNDIKEAKEFIRNFAKMKNVLNKQKSDIDKVFKSAIDGFSAVEKKAADGEKITGAFGSALSKLKTNVNTVVNIAQTAVAQETTIMKICYSLATNNLLSLV